MGGSADPRKGADLLLEALQRLRSQVTGTPLEQLELVVFGQSRPAQPPDPVAVRKDDVSAAIHAAKANVAGLGSISGCGGFIQTTSG